MSEYLHVEKPFLDQLGTLGWAVTDHGQGIIPSNPSERAQAPKLNWGLRIFFSEFVRVSLRRPSRGLFFVRTVLWQGGAARRRACMAREGVHVPPHRHLQHHQRVQHALKGLRNLGQRRRLST